MHIHLLLNSQVIVRLPDFSISDYVRTSSRNLSPKLQAYIDSLGEISLGITTAMPHNTIG